MTRDQFISELRKLARKNGWALEIFTNKGKGSHYRITLNGRMTTLKSGELTTGYVRLLKKQLGID